MKCYAREWRHSLPKYQVGYFCFGYFHLGVWRRYIGAPYSCLPFILLRNLTSCRQATFTNHVALCPLFTTARLYKFLHSSPSPVLRVLCIISRLLIASLNSYSLSAPCRTSRLRTAVRPLGATTVARQYLNVQLLGSPD